MSEHPVPMPLRAAAGLAAVAIDEARRLPNRAIDEARRLPNRLVSLPVLAAGGAMQATLKLQQRYTELVVRGDQLLAQLRGGAAETPPWARFDEDEEEQGAAVSRFARFDEYAEDTENLDEVGGRARFDDVQADAVLDDLGLTGAEEPTDSAAAGVAAFGAPTAGSPALPLPNYEELSIPQLRSRLRRLSAEDVERLIAHERTNQNRAPFLTMLENRLTALRGI